MAEKIEVGYTRANIVGAIRPTNPGAIYVKRVQTGIVLGQGERAQCFFSTLDNH